MNKQKQVSLDTATLCSPDHDVDGFTAPDPQGDDD